MSAKSFNQGRKSYAHKQAREDRRLAKIRARAQASEVPPHLRGVRFGQDGGRWSDTSNLSV